MLIDRGGQVFVSTHSPNFINYVSLESIFWLEKEQGISKVKRAIDNPLLQKLIAQGDLPGALWKQDFLMESIPDLWV